MKWDRSIGKPEPIKALNRIVELENNEPLVDLNIVCPSVVIYRSSVVPYLRKTVADMLNRASDSLPAGYQLAVVDALRPFQRQVRIFEWMWGCLEEARPDLPYSAKRRQICRFVAPTDQKAPPGHTTGAAVDVWLLDQEGNEVDVNSPHGRLQGAPTHVYGLTEEAKRNRMILYHAMMDAGFSNCRDEWWHYSYGDAAWAVRTGQTTCFYGKVEVDPSLYEDQEDAWLARLHERPNPFL
ncbi:M15 family metallopeptidase [Kamptonema cortianum]|nr:M15 family metallopeptidase [Geitlerinema splendidum]MDK3158617.1 M15 family metallopeptidase [Kamptonema cortianum]